MKPSEHAEQLRLWREFASTTYYELVRGFLADQAEEGQSVFAAANYNPYEAAVLDARQNIVRLFDDQVAKAEAAVTNPD